MPARALLPSILSAVLLCAPFMAVAPGAWAQSPTPRKHPQADLWVESAAPQGISSDEPLRFSTLARLAESLSPAVVTLLVQFSANAPAISPPGSPPWADPREPGQAQGTGFIIHPKGHILTNYHVIDGAREIRVRLRDSREYRARVVGTDPESDVALLRIEREEPFAAVLLGDSDRLQVGEHVMSIGNPMGLSHSVTSGIVSAVGRKNLHIEDKSRPMEFIQIDAPINPGNSGGPLISLRGEVVGINTAVNRQGQGIAFALPINAIKKLLPQLAKHGFAQRSWLGIHVQELDAALAASFGVPFPGGALVAEVLPEGPAARVSLQPGDVILSFDGTRIRQSDHLPWLVSTTEPGREVTMSLVREGRAMTLRMTLERQPSQKRPSLPAELSAPGQSPSKFLDIRVRPLTEGSARQLGAQGMAGVVVAQMGEGSVAERAGLRARDVVLEVSGRAVPDEQAFHEALAAQRAGHLVRLRVMRAGRALFIAFAMP